MLPGTLGDSDSSHNFDHSSRASIANPYERPSTSKAAAKSRRIVPTARKSTALPQVVSNTRPVGAARRKMSGRQKELKQLREIVKLQKITKLMIPKAPFSRVVREISFSINTEIVYYTETALEALQEATEMFLSQVLTDSYMLTIHRKCVTLSVADMVLLRSLKLDI